MNPRKQEEEYEALKIGSGGNILARIEWMYINCLSLVERQGRKVGVTPICIFLLRTIGGIRLLLLTSP